MKKAPGWKTHQSKAIISPPDYTYEIMYILTSNSTETHSLGFHYEDAICSMWFRVFHQIGQPQFMMTNEMSSTCSTLLQIWKKMVLFIFRHPWWWHWKAMGPTRMVEGGHHLSNRPLDPHPLQSVEWNYLSILKLQRLHCWSFGWNTKLSPNG